jgi:photosystem II stability/assembly factor-like uncharacterized protein
VSNLDRLTNQLRSDVSRTRWQEPDAIRARGDRRTVRRVTVGVGLAVVVVLAGVAVTVGLGHGRDQAAPVATPGTTSVTAPPTTPPTSSAPPAPAGLVAQDLSFVTPNVGWLISDRPSIVYTADGGRTWTNLPPLPPDVPADGTRIRFADAKIGYLYAPSVLYLTTDGGLTWTKQPGGAYALDLANGTALRVTSSSPGCPPGPGCVYDISSAPIGTADWRAVKVGAGGGVRADVQRVGHRAVAMVYINLAGGAISSDVLLTSGDDGRTWTTRPDPCETGDYAGDMTVMAPDGATAMLCYARRGSGPSRVITSTDGGVTFGTPYPAPGFVTALGASSARTLFVSVLVSSEHRLYRSGDGGASWALVATAPDLVQDGVGPSSRIVFPRDASTGWWLPGHATLFTTTDTGRTWTPATVS